MDGDIWLDIISVPLGQRHYFYRVNYGKTNRHLSLTLPHAQMTSEMTELGALNHILFANLLLNAANTAIHTARLINSRRRRHRR